MLGNHKPVRINILAALDLNVELNLSLSLSPSLARVFARFDCGNFSRATAEHVPPYHFFWILISWKLYYTTWWWWTYEITGNLINRRICNFLHSDCFFVDRFVGLRVLSRTFPHEIYVIALSSRVCAHCVCETSEIQFQIRKMPASGLNQNVESEIWRIKN